MMSYERLLARLHSLKNMVNQETPSDENDSRRRLIYLAIKAAIITSQAGIRGDEKLPSPGQLKHWLRVRIENIDKSFDTLADEKQASVAKKRKVAPTPETTPEKRQKKYTDEEEEAAMTPLALSRSPVVHSSQNRMATRRIVHGRKSYTKLPDVSQVEDPRESFLAGVKYALENLAPGEPCAPALNHVEFHNYVRTELDSKKAVEK